MKQYHEHLQAILDKGTNKPPAREGMPESKSLFGYQNIYYLQEGFPILTTKKISFRQIVLELLWFLSGDTNIKYLVRNSCNIWNEDAYNYYKKLCKEQSSHPLEFDEFIKMVKGFPESTLEGYSFGDCGHQYGKLWRQWEAEDPFTTMPQPFFDQVKDLISGLMNSPMSRRHIITAWNPSTLHQMALHACHCLVQFNCRPLTVDQRTQLFLDTCQNENDKERVLETKRSQAEAVLDELRAVKYFLDCQLYQRSADMFLGVPYNITSYALLTEIVAAVCNMLPGKFIHSFGDSHIYENHLLQVQELLSRDYEKYPLPKLSINGNFIDKCQEAQDIVIDEEISPKDFVLTGYESYPAIKAKLSTGLR